MLSKKERFSTEDLLLAQKQKNKKVPTPLGTFVVFEDGDSLGKKAIIISKKVSKSAVERNKLKRLFFNTTREIKDLKVKSFILHLKKTFTKEEIKTTLRSLVI
jgi:ribonuclease P protein component